MEGSTKASPMVQMNRKSVISEDSVILNDLLYLIGRFMLASSLSHSLERLVMMSVHVTNHEVKNWHVHQVEKASTGIIRSDISNLMKRCETENIIHSGGVWMCRPATNELTMVQ